MLLNRDVVAARYSRWVSYIVPSMTEVLVAAVSRSSYKPILSFLGRLFNDCDFFITKQTTKKH